MSIIHEALKKAEREREPTLLKPSMYRGVTTSGRSWWVWRAVTWLIGASVLGGVGAWAWFGSPRVSFITKTTQPSASLERPLSPTESSTEPHSPEPSGVAPISGALGQALPPGRHPILTDEDAQNAARTFAEARTAEISGHSDRAISLYRQAITLNPELAEARNNLGHLLIQNGDIPAAITELRTALTINPDDALARNNLGSAYLLHGEETAAIQEFLAALRLDKTYVSPYYNLALLYARRRDLEPAIAFLTKALALEPEVLTWMREEPEFASIRDTPEFQRLRSSRQVSRR